MPNIAKSLKIKALIIIILQLVILFLSGVAAAQEVQLEKLNTDTNFLEINLPRGLSFPLPKNWMVLSNNQLITLGSAVESMKLDLSGSKDTASNLNFAANLYSDLKKTIGILNVRFYPGMNISQEDVRSFSQHDVQIIDKELYASIQRFSEKTGIRILSWQGTIKKNINGIAILLTEYRRESLYENGSFNVRLVRVLAGPKSFTLTVSYDENMAVMLKPITDHVIDGISVSGIEKSPRLRKILPGEVIVLDSGEIITGNSRP